MNRMILWLSTILLPTMFSTSFATAEEYPIFDGRFYNGLYYPRINVLEWGDPLHMEFNIYSKDKPVEISGQIVKRGAQKVFEFAYDLTFRGERLCRSVVVPDTFKAGQTLFFYQDTQDRDMNKIILSAQPLNGFQKYNSKAYSGCQEVAATREPLPKRPQKRQIASPQKKTLIGLVR